MKKIFLLLLLPLLFNCQSSPVVLAPYTPHFENFEIRKILETGIQKVEIKNGKNIWPDVVYNELSALKFNKKNLKFAVIGDTGCRMLESSYMTLYQNCSSASEWPYAEVVRAVVKEKYDFVVHTGDYHYREQCSDKKLCPEYTKSIGYGWNSWWDDFYGPSQALFKKSPILFVRGNHEDCNRAFAGWGPLSVSQKTFVLKSAAECTETESYQWIELGDLVLINFDDSAFQDRSPSPEEVRNKWLVILKEIADRISVLGGKKEIWFLAHKPVAGFFPDKQAEPKAIGDFLLSLIIESGLVSKIDYFLSGHIHNQQIVLSEKDLLQLIVGHSGSALDPFGRKLNDERLISTTDSKTSFGYAVFERKSFKKWKLIYKDLNGKTVLTCQAEKNKVTCK